MNYLRCETIEKRDMLKQSLRYGADIKINMERLYVQVLEVVSVWSSWHVAKIAKTAKNQDFSLLSHKRHLQSISFNLKSKICMFDLQNTCVYNFFKLFKTTVLHCRYNDIDLIIYRFGIVYDFHNIWLLPKTNNIYCQKGNFMFYRFLNILRY